MTLTPAQRTPPDGARAAQAAASAESAAASPQAAQTESFGAYVRDHFEQSRGLAIWGIAAGLLAVPLISLAKPVLGIGGILMILKIVVAVTVLAGLWYLFERFQAFALKQRGLTDETERDWPAAFVYGCVMFLIPVAITSVCECFAPPDGLVASLVLGSRDEPALPTGGSEGALAQAPPTRPASKRAETPVRKREPAAAAPPQPATAPEGRQTAAAEARRASPPPAAAPAPKPPAAEPAAPPGEPASVAAEPPMEKPDQEKTETAMPQPSEPDDSVVRSLFIIRERDENGPPVRGARVELWHRLGAAGKENPLGSAMTDARGQAEIAVPVELTRQMVGEYGATVTRGSTTKSWILSDYPESAGWNLHLPAP